MIVVDIPSREDNVTNQKKKSHLSLRCVHLLASFLLPSAIITYTILYNQSSIKIAEKNREQDLAIAEQRYGQDFEVANQRYEQDVYLANEKQEQAVLAEYLDALASLLQKYGMELNKSEVARPIARYKTLAALEQLKCWKRKSILVRSLFESNLIRIEGDGIYRKPSISIWTADLTGIVLRPDIYKMGMLLRCLDLGYTNLTNSSFQKTDISGSMFNDCRMTNSDFSFTFATLRTCSNEQTFGVIFAWATLIHCNFTHSIYHQADFKDATLIRARMSNFSCYGCSFAETKIDFADLSFTTFKPYKNQSFKREAPSEQTSNFSLTSMVFTRLYYVTIECGQFHLANMTQANATRASFVDCSFEQAILINMSLDESTISNSTFAAANLARSTWTRAKVINTSFVEAHMYNVRFTHGECRYCLFDKANLTDVDFTNTSLLGSNFIDAIITSDQLKLARSLKGIVFPNGTRSE